MVYLTLLRDLQEAAGLVGDLAPVEIRDGQGRTYALREVYAHGGRVVMLVESEGFVQGSRAPLGPIRGV